MPKRVKTRTYNSPRRREQAAATRQRILVAAQDLFTSVGYPATSVSDVARRAAVSIDTVYAACGRKPQLLLGVIDMVLGGEDAEGRDYVRAVHAQPTARGKLETYAAAAARLVPEVAPLQEALRKAGDTDAECLAVWRRLTDRRAANMARFAAELRRTGELRPDLADSDVADILWSTNAAEYWLLLKQRGWGAQAYERLLVDMWTRTLLVETTA